MVSRNEIAYEFDPYRREVMRALCFTKLSGADFRVLLFLLGQTNGYHRAQDKIRPAFFVERTGMDKGNIRRTIVRLRKWHMITKNGQFYEVLPPDQWAKEVFVETKNRFNLEALLAEEPTENRFKSEAESPPAYENRFQIEAPTASKLKRPEVEIEAVLASSKEHYLKNTLKKKAPTSTTDESKILDILRELKGWRYDQADDLAWLREFVQDFPDFDLEQLKLARDYYSGRPPPKHKGIWRKRLRNWMLKKPEFEGLKETPGPRGKSFEQWKKEQQEEGT